MLMTSAGLQRAGRYLGAIVAIAAAIVCASIPSAQAEKRVALVIGNAGYRNVMRLDSPGNDAKRMAETLRSLGFKVIGPLLDLEEPAMRRAVQSFGEELYGADAVLFYYAGHGLQLRGKNYLVPVDANPTRESDVEFRMIDTGTVLREMENAGSRLNIVILDASRSNPFTAAGLRAIGNGLAPMQAPRGTLISFAAQPGKVASESSGDSIFTKTLTQTMAKPGLDILRMFQDVGDAVSQATRGGQQPWLSVAPIRADFFFGGAPEVKMMPPPAGAAPVAPWRCDGKCIDAGIHLPGNRTILFRGNQYARFTGDELDKGYPLPIAGRWPFPDSWSSGIDAAVDWGGGRVYFFKRDQFMRYEIGADGHEIAYPPLPIATHWPSLPKSWGYGIDAGINWGNGKAYFFKGNQYLRYDMVRDEVDPGFPKPIDGNWTGFPKEWSSGIDAAMNWGSGIVYFFKDGQYLRYDIKSGEGDFSAQAPRPVAGNWPGFR
jgi:hypothetical protein